MDDIMSDYLDELMLLNEWEYTLFNRRLNKQQEVCKCIRLLHST